MDKKVTELTIPGPIIIDRQNDLQIHKYLIVKTIGNPIPVTHKKNKVSQNFRELFMSKNG